MSRTKYDWTRLDSDINGNPRYVIHFLNFADNYPDAVKLANKIGGRKYHTKKYGGGIVFQSYSLPNTEMHIDRVKRDALMPEMLEALAEIQGECESMVDGLEEATLGVIAMKARKAIAKATEANQC